MLHRDNITHEPRIIYWLEGEERQNFGDFLAVYLLRRALLGARIEAAAYRLTGSALAEGIINTDLETIDAADGGRMVYWGCGMRDEARPSARLLSRCDLMGVRGPLTRDALELPMDTVLGDPGLLMPLVYRPKSDGLTAGRTVCVPHFNDRKDDETLLALSGAEVVVRPGIQASLSAVEEMIDRIAGARFVLAGALHAAVIASAYNIPFAFWDNGHVDIPFKWRDFAASLDVTAYFVRDVRDGLEVYDRLLLPRMKKPDLLPILRVCPFFVRSSVLVRAVAADGVVADVDVEPIATALSGSDIESAQYIVEGRVSVGAARQQARAAFESLSRHASETETALRAELALALDTVRDRDDALSRLRMDAEQHEQHVAVMRNALEESGRAAEERIEAERLQHAQALQSLRGAHEDALRAAEERIEAERLQHAQALQSLRNAHEDDLRAADARIEAERLDHAQIVESLRRAMESVRGDAETSVRLEALEKQDAITKLQLARDEIEAGEARLRELEAHLERISGSRSWRYTSPLRGALIWSKRQELRARFAANALKPGRAEERRILARALYRRIPIRERLLRLSSLRKDIASENDTDHTDAYETENGFNDSESYHDFSDLWESLSNLGYMRRFSVPTVSATEDNTTEINRLIDGMRDCRVVVFRDVLPGQLDAFFALRLNQLARGVGPMDAVSVVLLRPDAEESKLPPGFAMRAKSGWPFARAIFATAAVAMQPIYQKLLGLEVQVVPGALASTAGLPDPVLSDACAGQSIAVQIQPRWGRCGSSTAFENQIESLVKLGNFVIRIFIDDEARPGGTLDHGVRRLLEENSVNAGSHINVLALPCSPGVPGRDDRSELDRFMLTVRGRDACRIADQTAATVARDAGSVIVNHVVNVGFALRTCPRAAMLLDVHDEFAAAAAQRMQRETEALNDEQAAELAEIEHIEGLLWRIPDICANVSIAERDRVARHNDRAVIVLPRPYVVPAVNPEGGYDWDALIVADQHGFNVLSVRWFLDEIWKTDRRIRDLRIAIAGRVDRHINSAEYLSPNLRFLGFVDDLDSLRRRSVLTLVPDRAGTGIAIKTLTALAAGHPVVSTDIGLRGLGDAVRAAVPNHRDAKSLAEDLLSLLSDDGKLAARREAVGRAYRAIEDSLSFDQCFAGLGAPSEAGRPRREELWGQVSQRLPPMPKPVPAKPIDPDLAKPEIVLSAASLEPYLDRGWHAAESWGRWMDGARARIVIPFAAPVTAPLVLVVDVMMGIAGIWLEITVNTLKLPRIAVIDGRNSFALTEACVAGAACIDLVLTVSKTFRPADDGKSKDDRVLGLGLRSISLARP